MAEPLSVLRQYWGHRTFRPLQDEVVDAVLNGRDTLAMMPTGGGKSICFQVPALCLEGLCLVITPLISLMKDQLEHLKERGIPALAVHSGMQRREVEKTFKNALYGNFKFLYLSPERLQTRLFLDYLEDLPINLITVDEAHCISQWGYDFRPAYLRIGEMREMLPEVPVLALTATATPRVCTDIQEKLLFRKENMLAKSFYRENLAYSVFHGEDKSVRVLNILKQVPGTGLVFCRSRRRTQEVAEHLYKHGVDADFYHAGLPVEERNRRQEAWISGRQRVMVCTNAFGMGIDKPDVRTVIHYDLPESPEAYYQEAGRAGRDEKEAYAVLLSSGGELNTLKRNLDLYFPEEGRIREVYRAIVSYLKLPAGSGEGQYFNFDLVDFVGTFHLNTLLVYHVLRLLEQEEFLAFSEHVFLPSRISFTTTKKALYQFEKDFPVLAPMTECLLRTYEGIFDDYVQVSEKEVARMTKSSESTVLEQWRRLQQFGILDFVPVKDKPQIFFVQERIVVDELKLNMAHIRERRKRYEERVDAMIAYSQNKTSCRSSMLLAYFGETDHPPCGHCDVCLHKQQEA